MNPVDHTAMGQVVPAVRCTDIGRPTKGLHG